MPLPHHIKDLIIELVNNKVPYSQIMKMVKNRGYKISKGGITYVKNYHKPNSEFEDLQNLKENDAHLKYKELEIYGNKYRKIQENENNIFYFEYFDHGRIFRDPQDIFKNPLKLWCVGKIVNESEDFLAVLCSGIKGKASNPNPAFEIIFKRAITLQRLIYV